MPEKGRANAMKKTKGRVFSVLKAVKANARARVGTPPPEKVLPDLKDKAGREPKHRETLQRLLEKSGEE